MRFIKIISFTLIFFTYLPVFSQSKDVKLPANWYNLDLTKDGYFGISTEKAYSLLAGKNPKQKVIVAVIDGGVDVNHEDLKDVLWTNKKEIAGNGLMTTEMDISMIFTAGTSLDQRQATLLTITWNLFGY